MMNQIFSGQLCNPSFEFLFNIHRLPQTPFTDMDLPQREAPPSLQVLSLIDSHLCDEFFTDLHSLYCGRQIPLTEVDVSSNNNLTAKCVHSLAKITTGIAY